MFILLVQVEAKPEQTEAFRTALRVNASKSVEGEAECLRFDISAVVDAPNKFVFYEVYTSEEAWQAHRRTAHFLEYNAVAERALVSRVITRLAPV